MRLAWIFFALVTLGVGTPSCDVSNSLGSDFGIQLPGCYGPSACWKVACDCVFATTPLSVENGGCMQCDPTTAPNGLCNCSGIDDAGISTGVMCLEQAQVCVGTAKDECDGTCVHKGESCIDPTVDHTPPDEVASKVGDGGSPGTEKHCPYVDDVCCP